MVRQAGVELPGVERAGGWPNERDFRETGRFDNQHQYGTVVEPGQGRQSGQGAQGGQGERRFGRK